MGSLRCAVLATDARQFHLYCAVDISERKSFAGAPQHLSDATSNDPTLEPTRDPTVNPTTNPFAPPTQSASRDPTSQPSVAPSRFPTIDADEAYDSLIAIQFAIANLRVADKQRCPNRSTNVRQLLDGSGTTVA